MKAERIYKKQAPRTLVQKKNRTGDDSAVSVPSVAV